MITLASLNTNGAKGIALYIYNLINSNEIVFLCEHWINKFDKNTFDNLSLNKNINKIFFSPMNHVNNKGRPWGGQGWFISKKIEILRHEVLEDGISLIEIEYENEKLVIIGVYLACVSSNLEQKIKYDGQLLILKEKILQIIERVEKHEVHTRMIFTTVDKQYVSRISIKEIIKDMKNSNTRGYDGMNNNMIKGSNSELCYDKITTLINAILNTGYIPKNLNRSIIIPIIKDKTKKTFEVNNYRPISVSNVLAQILEKVILLKCSKLYNSSILQFGFKKSVSTMHPLFLLKELMHKHKKEKSPLYIAFLDSEKAYDSVWRDGIFVKLLEEIEPQFWLVLREYYNQSDGVFKINGDLEREVIKITRGVKQGGVLSPQLFNFFINDLLCQIQTLGYGCKISEVRIPIMGYCDDTTLLATVLQHLSKLIEFCEQFSKKWLLKYNFKKSFIVNGGEEIYKDEDINIFMGGVRLPVVGACKYLGININKFVFYHFLFVFL